MKKFSELANTLHNLTRKDAAWNWAPDYQQAFNKLENSFVTKPALAIFNWGKEAKGAVEVNSSNRACGGTFSQLDNNGTLKPVACFPAKHSAQEYNDKIHDEELLGVVRALEEWTPELKELKKEF